MSLWVLVSAFITGSFPSRTASAAQVLLAKTKIHSNRSGKVPAIDQVRHLREVRDEMEKKVYFRKTKTTSSPSGAAQRSLFCPLGRFLGASPQVQNEALDIIMGCGQKSADHQPERQPPQRTLLPPAGVEAAVTLFTVSPGRGRSPPHVSCQTFVSLVFYSSVG